MDMLTKHLGRAGTQIPLNAGRSAYNLDLAQAEAETSSDLDALPSLDYTLYLINTVRSHLGQLFHLFDPVEKAKSARLWLVQFKLVLAFGKAFLAQSSTAGVPPGFEHFSNAMASLPDIMSLNQSKYPLESIEIFCLVALYLQSADHRNAAYVYASAFEGSSRFVKLSC